MNIMSIYRRTRSLKWISPGSFVVSGLTFAGVYAVLHGLGFREYTSILCGTLPAGRGEQVVVGFCGIIYTLLYMLAVLAAPALMLGAGLFWIAQRILFHQGPPAQS